MICKKCNTENSEGNKYCINCGNELTNVNQSQSNYCKSCGAENEPENKYCTTCGDRLAIHDDHIKEYHQQDKHHKHADHEKKKKHHEHPSPITKKNFSGAAIGIKPLLITLALLFVSIGVIALLNPLFFTNEEELYPKESKSLNPAVEAKVFEIASKFVCSCGDCNEESLEKCKCAKAFEERQFVRDYLERNNKDEDIIAALANRYGYLKAEYAKNYNIDKSKIWTPITLQYQTNSTGLINQNSLKTKATLADVSVIHSAFRCPCGRCSVPELKDCTCSHPNGAVEVKQFVNDRINESEFTVNEIIDQVQAKYGGKKL